MRSTNNVQHKSPLMRTKMKSQLWLKGVLVAVLTVGLVGLPSFPDRGQPEPKPVKLTFTAWCDSEPLKDAVKVKLEPAPTGSGYIEVEVPADGASSQPVLYEIGTKVELTALTPTATSQSGKSCANPRFSENPVEMTTDKEIRVIYTAQPQPAVVKLTVHSNCENAEIDVNGQKVSGKGGIFQFKPGDKVQLSVRDFPTINFCGLWQAVHTFDGWYDGSTLKSKGQRYPFTITQDTEILAKYGLGERGRGCEVMIDAKTLSGTQIPGVEIKVSPLDYQSNGDGQTPFVRLFDENTEFTLVAPWEWPPAAPKYAFHNWNNVVGAEVISAERPAVKLRCTSGNVWATALYEEKGLLALADLTVISLTVSVSKAGITGRCDVTGVAIVKNIGNGDAGPFATGIFVDGRLDFDFPLTGLKAGASASVPIFTEVTEGMYLIEAVADWKNEVNESNEQNNKAARLVKCS